MLAGSRDRLLEKSSNNADKNSAARNNNSIIIDACNSWHSGAYLLETVPCVLYILQLHADRGRLFCLFC
jgi:hypothetical protein